MGISALRSAIAILVVSAFGHSTVLAADNDSVEAKIKDPQNKVLVNQGQGLVSVKEGFELRDGDTVITLEKSGTTIVFHDGCRITLKENEKVTIDHGLHCKAAILSSSGAAGAVGAGTAGGLTLGQGLALGGIIVGGGILIGNGNGGSNNGNNQPISPQ